MFRTAYVPPTNNLRLILDIAISPPNQISVHLITFVDSDLRSNFFSWDEEEALFLDLDECTKIYRCVDNGDGGLTHDGFDHGAGAVYGRDSHSCNDRAYLEQSNACSKAPVVGKIAKTRRMTLVQGG